MQFADLTAADRPDGGSSRSRAVWGAMFAASLVGLATVVSIAGGDSSTVAAAAAPGFSPAPEVELRGDADAVALIDVDGRLVARPLGDGAESVLAVAGPGESLGGLAAGPDGAVYFHRVRDGGSWCGPEATIEVVRSGAASAHVIGDGLWPAPSADGLRLAYADTPACTAVSESDAPMVEHALVVRELATGAERRWRWTQPHAFGDDSPGWPTAGTWLERGVLAYGRNLAGGDAGTVWLLDTTTDGGQLGGTDLGPAEPDSWWDPTADPRTGRIVVLAPRYDEASDRVETSVIAVNPADSSDTIDVWQAPAEILQIDVNPSTGELLYVERDPATGNLALRHHRPGGSVDTVVPGVSEAVWLR